ncbi:MAG: metalloregulator ArsR/SmtB family transcription factor [Candidatus Veblenbacteria bacterium]|nr:metalloregulator ArsR/SmtB family transcription factor [Candidatus Veblenbacteria bacterium]MDZ4229745.1 metalloregulator ArsR/SmtB family transcription factor [Candidatus Veblenbacteria bacterium]
MYQVVFRKHAGLLKALANSKRLEVIHLLRQGRLTVSDMERMLGLRQANLSQHLMVLRKFGVVRAERNGKAMYYRLAHPNFMRASDAIREVLIQNMGGAAARATALLTVVKDPMCGMRLTPVSAAGHVKVGKRTYYFCGTGCAREFKNHQH